MSLSLVQYKTIKPKPMLTHPTRNFSSLFVLKAKFSYDELVRKRGKGVDMNNTRGFIKDAPNMINKLNSGQKLSEEEVKSAAHVGITCRDGVPLGNDLQILEMFAQDKGAIKEYTRAIKKNEQEMENMIKGKSNDQSTSSPSGQSNFQDSSDITGEGDLADYFSDD